MQKLEVLRDRIGDWTARFWRERPSGSRWRGQAGELKRERAAADRGLRAGTRGARARAGGGRRRRARPHGRRVDHRDARPRVRQRAGSRQRQARVGRAQARPPWSSAARAGWAAGSCRFLADQGYATGALDIRASDEENAWARQALPSADLVISATPPVATAALYERVDCRSRHPASSPTSPASRRRSSARFDDCSTPGARVASLHPMFGPSVVLLRDCDVVICDTGDAGRDSAKWSSCSDRPPRALLHLPLDEHDRLMADVLTLAHATVDRVRARASGHSRRRCAAPRWARCSALSSQCWCAKAPTCTSKFRRATRTRRRRSTRLAAAIERVQSAVRNDDAEAFAALMQEGQARARTTDI